MSGRPEPPDWLAAGPVRGLLDILGADGGEARPVGGAVRNWLIGLPPGDIDIATTLPPGEVAKRTSAAGFKVVPTGIEHGTVTVVIDGTGFEVTTLREDIETDGRRAVVRFGRDWKADAARRDFTINAMSLSPDGALHDFFGGADDLRVGRVRFIGDAVQRIREDRLRILRFFRFQATYGAGEPDSAALSACIAEREGLAELSRERVRAELIKLLLAPRAAGALQVMADAGLLGPLLGGVPLVGHLARLARIEAECACEPSSARRLGALAVLVREDADRLRGRLALSNEEYRRLDGIGAGWTLVDPGKGRLNAKIMLALAGPRTYRDRALIAFARSGAPVDDPAWRETIALPDHWKAPAFPVSGADLAARGVEQGPAMGQALSQIKQAWMKADFPTTRAAINELINVSLNSARL